MRIIIAGGRNATRDQVFRAIELCPWVGFVSCVVSGAARGADTFGEEWAEENGVSIVRFPADWKKYGRRAGPVRNEVMAKNAEGLVAVWDGESRGTGSMIRLAMKHGLRVFVLLTTEPERRQLFDPKGAVADAWMEAEERAGILQFGSDLDERQAERQAGAEAVQSRVG